MFQHERRYDDSTINLFKRTVQLMNASVQHSRPVRSAISHLWIRVRWPLQGSGWRTGSLGPRGHVNNLSMQRRRILWSAIFKGGGGDGVVCGCGPTKTKSVLFVVAVIAFTSELLFSSAFCVIHTCRRDLKRMWDLLLTYLVVPSGHSHLQRAGTMAMLPTQTSKGRSSAAISSNTGIISQTTKQVWVLWKCSLCLLTFNILINIPPKRTCMGWLLWFKKN